MQRHLFFAYGVLSYVAFLVTTVFFVGFVGNFGVPKTLDSAPAGPLGTALAVNLMLLLGFGLQHSVMARPAFKRIWTRWVPEPIERSTYMLASCLALVLLMHQWRTIDLVVWDVRSPAGRGVLWTLFGLGWLLVPVVSLMIDHFDLFGLRQVWLHLHGRPYRPLPFRTPYLYRYIRHPLYIGWALAFWATPTLTAGHLLFAGVMTVYMVLASRIEERDLVAHFGADYADYRRRVPAFVPRIGGKAA